MATLESRHECPECSFVNDRESILLPFELRQNISSKPVFLGLFTLPGWSGHSGFYAFKCRRCGRVNVDYPHGHVMYFTCFDCPNPEAEWSNSTNFRIVDRSIYEREKVPIPESAEEIERILGRTYGKERTNLFKSLVKNPVTVFSEQGSEIGQEIQARSERAVRFIAGCFILALVGIFWLAYLFFS